MSYKFRLFLMMKHMLRALNSMGISLLYDHYHCKVTSSVEKYIPFFVEYIYYSRMVGLGMMMTRERKSKSRICNFQCEQRA